MRRDLAELSRREHDLVIVGGGSFGLALAWEAASRGLAAALVERDDYGAATSANCFKMVHGGIRYLQHGDLPRIRESCAERRSLLRIAPHLVRPLPILVPTYPGALTGRAAMRAAMALYDLLTLDRNRGLGDRGSRVPRGRILSRRELLELVPQLEPSQPTGAALFHDGQMYSAPRLALAFLQSAASCGAVAANYAEVVGFLRRGNRVVGVEVVDRIGGERLEVRGRMVVNAAGPWAAPLLERLSGARLPRRPVFSRDACFVVPRPLMPGVALAIQGATSDPDALLSRGKRHLFVVPWREATLVGVWHVVHDGDPDRFTVTDPELAAFLAEVNAALPGLSLGPDDVSHWHAGLVLFGENDRGATDLSYGKRSWIVDHARTEGVDGLVTVIGVRYTTARSVAARTIDGVARRLGLHAAPSRTADRPLHGGDFDELDGLVHQVRSETGLEERLAAPLARNHGSRWPDVWRHAVEQPALARTLGRSTTLAAEVVHAVREEMALRLTDVVLGRTDLGTAGPPAEDALRECAALMGQELAWGAARTEEEIRIVRSRYLGS